jgi:hypothetical protein
MTLYDKKMRDRGTGIIVDPWEKALPSRIRTLLLTSPLHRMESTKGHRMAELLKQDLRMLALRVMDATIERMGLGYGAAREAIISEIVPLAQKADETLSLEDARAVVEIVIEGLLNEGERRQAFREPYASVESGGVTWREFSFNLLEEFSPDDNVYLRVTVEGIHLYTGMLGFNIEDAQVANEVVLQYQISRGRLSDAVQTAREAEFRSIQYDAQIQGLLNAARRDIHQVDWVKDALSAIGAARDHILQRLSIEKQILDAIEEKYESAHREEIQQLTALKQQVNRCMVRHMQLHKLLISVNPDYLDEQLQQGFTVSGFNPLPNIDKEIFQPALMFTVGQLKGSATGMIGAFAPPQPPHLFSLELLIEKLTAPIREDNPRVLDTETPDLNEIETDKGTFSAADEENVQLLLQETSGSILLSKVLEFAKQQSMPLSTQRLLVLDALRNFGAEEGEAGYPVRLAGEKLEAAGFEGDDLTLEVKV